MYGGKVFGSRTRSTGGGFKRPEPIEKDVAKANEVFKPGDRVSHKMFGPGVVLAASGDVIEVRFSKTGKTKKLMKGFAPIVKIEG
jgi:DNA helicase-2/ATP-dependent DNA helicase PcrA